MKTFVFLAMLGASLSAEALSVNWPVGPVSPNSQKQCRDLGRQYQQISNDLYAKRSSQLKAIQARHNQLIARYGSWDAQDKMEHSKHSSAPACSDGDTYGYPSQSTLSNAICDVHNRKLRALTDCRQKVSENNRRTEGGEYHSAAVFRSAGIYATRVASAKAASNSYIYRKLANYSNKALIANSFLELSTAKTKTEKQSALTSLAKHAGSYPSRGNLLSSTALSIAFSYLQSVQENAYSEFYSSWQSFDQDYASISKAGTSYGSGFAKYYNAYNDAVRFNKSVFGNMNSMVVDRSYLDVVVPKFTISPEYLAQQERIRDQRAVEQARIAEAERRAPAQRASRERESSSNGGLLNGLMDVMGAAAGAYGTYRALDSASDMDESSSEHISKGYCYHLGSNSERSWSPTRPAYEREFISRCGEL